MWSLSCWSRETSRRLYVPLRSVLNKCHGHLAPFHTSLAAKAAGTCAEPLRSTSVVAKRSPLDSSNLLAVAYYVVADKVHCRYVKHTGASKRAPCRSWEGPTPAGGLPAPSMGDGLQEIREIKQIAVHKNLYFFVHVGYAKFWRMI